MDFVFDKHLSVYVVNDENEEESVSLLKISKPYYLRRKRTPLIVFVRRHLRSIVIMPFILFLFVRLVIERPTNPSIKRSSTRNAVDTYVYEKRESKPEHLVNTTNFDPLPELPTEVKVHVQDTKTKNLEMFINVLGKDTKDKPIIYTYLEEFDPFIEDNLLDLFTRAWTNAGWDIKFLSLEDAKKHHLYDQFDRRLTKMNMCCLPRQSYMRHLAMSTVKKGGLFSELFVYPLRPNLHREFLNDNGLSYPNGNNFTSWDGIFSSVMSGSNEEWNRITELLLKNLKMNAVLSLEKIHKESSGAYHHGTLVTGPYKILSDDQFEIDICTTFKDFSFIRFHTGDLRAHGIDKEDRTAVASSWFKIYNARCFARRPVIFTFYEPVSYLSEEGPDDLLEVWRTLWLKAGWQPVVLRTGDAMRHPSYKAYAKILEEGYFKHNYDRYNYFCFLRWIAAAASGGGWMSDYDTFPLNLAPNHTLPNNGQFTIHAYWVPNLVSGSASEWNRMSKLIIWAFRRNEKLLKDHKKASVTTDMYATKFLFKTMTAFVAEQSTRQIHEFYTHEVRKNKPSSINPYDLKHKCFISDDMKAVHFSHWSCGQVRFCKETVSNNTSLGVRHHFQRSKVIQIWLEAWNTQCKERRHKHSDS